MNTPSFLNSQNHFFSIEVEATIICGPQHLDDIHTINFEGHLYNSLRSNGTPRELYDVPNTIINTSCEHIENWDKWWNSIPDGKLCILQSNNYKELSEHINCVDNVDHFKSIAPMKNYLYEGDLNLGKYIRYMIIGIK